jgi:hypothetical protein
MADKKKKLIPDVVLSEESSEPKKVLGFKRVLDLTKFTNKTKKIEMVPDIKGIKDRLLKTKNDIESLKLSEDKDEKLVLDYENSVRVGSYPIDSGLACTQLEKDANTVLDLIEDADDKEIKELLGRLMTLINEKISSIHEI